MKNAYKKQMTNKGVRYFPDTEDECFNNWNEHGYKSAEKIIQGYFAYCRWLEQLDRKTLKEFPKF